MRRNERPRDIPDEEPILLDGWREGGVLFPDSSGNEMREVDACETDWRGGTGAGGRGEPAERDGGAPAFPGGGGHPARVPSDGGAGEYPAGLDRGPDREPDPAAQRSLGRGDLLPGGDGNRETLTDSLNRSMEDGNRDGAGLPMGDGARDSRPFGNGDPDRGGGAGFDGSYSPQAQLRVRAQAARILYPELRDLSDEDAVAVVLGGGMLGAYAGFRAREAARLRQENDALRSHRDASRRAPVRSVSRGGPSPRGQDLFEQGFDQDGW